ncbi:hypothetical protein FXF51_35930 [Nonomuraea sp. PA05]|uniref:hypothetical protein n=1 Tax=Nonomuraea sp. PA05 TaxID=2604466 RepID=UPI0011D4C8A1|nr:hypothetical protein [Nonomuraea sp. PA05]TYB58917.1 hypothetical protein FXF51_35930 [Nonomuraea sp. PA05]
MYVEVAAGRSPAPRDSHPEQTWAPVGGRIAPKRVRELIDAVTTTSKGYGYPRAAANDARISFDRDAAKVIRDHLDLSWAEAGNRDLWSFLSLVALPHVTMWRFGPGNKERWVATDLTRHTWARLWWQAVIFAGHEQVLAALTESDLNQLLERRSIGGDPRLVREMASAVIELAVNTPRRPVIRDVTARLRRYLAFLDVRALSNPQIRNLCLTLTSEAVTRLATAQHGTSESTQP